MMNCKEAKPFEVTPAVPPTHFDNGTESVVICWGDSITQSKVGHSFPSQLEQNLGGQYVVYNAGAAGETSIAIMSRANVAEIFLQYDIEFPAGCEFSNVFNRGIKDEAHPISASKYTECWLVDKNSNNVYYTVNGNLLPITNVVIGGTAFELIEVNEGKTNVWGHYEKLKLKRKGDTTDAITLAAGSRVTFDYSDKYTNSRCAIVLFGANDYYFDENTPNAAERLNALINSYKAVGNTAENALYIIPYFWPTDITEGFVKAFGEDADKLVNMREYLRVQAFTDYGLTPTEEDIAWIDKNCVPPCFWVSIDKGPDCHLNHLGYKIIADVIYKQGVKLGFWK